ncbi:MAG: DUF6691 family protein [Candidatus Promineifilaceae bacterium]|nr:DUF6691 family protein [Candidatus Promineifilaceae bacterium]
MQNIRVMILGILFGIVLVKGQVVSWFRIQEMFRFESAYMYLVITSAVVVAAISLLIIRWVHARTIDGEEIIISKKGLNKGTSIGGIIFGLGWAITGACPGPIYAQIGSGTYLAIVTFLAALTGAYLYAIARPRLPV